MEPALKRTKVSSEGRTVGIASSDVVRLCLQFMQENQMRESAAALQRESSVALNTVPSMERFVADVKAGRWDAVLRQVGSIELPPPKLFDLYEQVVVELLELREVDTARKLLREAPSIDAM